MKPQQQPHEVRPRGLPDVVQQSAERSRRAPLLWRGARRTATPPPRGEGRFARTCPTVRESRGGGCRGRAPRPIHRDFAALVNAALPGVVSPPSTTTETTPHPEDPPMPP